MQADIIDIVQEPIDARGLASRLLRSEDGAVVTFEGVVRNNSGGRRTLYLEYETYQPMAVAEMRRLADRAHAEFEIGGVAVVHRVGRLEIGEASVVIVVTAAHRGPSFDACRALIDWLKKTVPIWKKEHFTDGAVWVEGQWDPSVGAGNT